MSQTPKQRALSKKKKKIKPRTKGMSLKFKMVESKDITYKNKDNIDEIEKEKKKFFLKGDYISANIQKNGSRLRKNNAFSESLEIHKQTGRPEYENKYRRRQKQGINNQPNNFYSFDLAGQDDQNQTLGSKKVNLSVNQNDLLGKKTVRGRQQFPQIMMKTMRASLNEHKNRISKNWPQVLNKKISKTHRNGKKTNLRIQTREFLSPYHNTGDGHQIEKIYSQTTKNGPRRGSKSVRTNKLTKKRTNQPFGKIEHTQHIQTLSLDLTNAPSDHKPAFAKGVQNNVAPSSTRSNLEQKNLLKTLYTVRKANHQSSGFGDETSEQQFSNRIRKLQADTISHRGQGETQGKFSKSVKTQHKIQSKPPILNQLCNKIQGSFNMAHSASYRIKDSSR